LEIVAALGSLGMGERLSEELERFLSQQASTLLPPPAREALVLRGPDTPLAAVVPIDPDLVPRDVVDLGAGCIVEPGPDSGTFRVSCRLSNDAPPRHPALWARALRSDTGAIVAMAQLTDRGHGVDDQTLSADLFVVEEPDRIEFEITARATERPQSHRRRSLRDAIRLGRLATRYERLRNYEEASRHWLACAARWADLDADRQVEALAYASVDLELIGKSDDAAALVERIDMLQPDRATSVLVRARARRLSGPFFGDVRTEASPNDGTRPPTGDG
jgi:hypothetical protein